MKRLLLITACLLTALGLRAQSLRTCRYWFDRDFGDAVTTSFNGNSGQLQLNVDALPERLHTLHLQVADTSLNWGPTKSYLFVKPEDYGQEYLSYRCWFDQDYGSSVSENLVDGTLLLDVSGLRSGMHTVHLLLESSSVTSTKSYLFMKPENYGFENLSYRYWFDQDYQSSVNDSLVDGAFLLDVSELRSGMHTLHLMFESSTVTSTKSFLFMKPENYGFEILSYRYWFDRDYESSVSENYGDGPFILDVSGLKSGMHTLHLMFEGSTKTSTKNYLFMKPEDYSFVSYRCWFDYDYNIGNQQTGSLESGTMLLDVSDLSNGIHTMHIQFEGSTMTSTKSYLFLKVPETEDCLYRCWFDQDESTVQTGQVVGSGFLLDVSALSIGQHDLFVQLSSGDLSSPRSYTFFHGPNITVIANPEEGGTVSTQLVDSICTITATANQGYNFVNWTENGSQVTTETSYSFVVTENDVARTFVANFMFTGVNYTVNATANPVEGGMVEGAGTYPEGSLCTLTATPNDGYTFVNWIKDSVEVSTEATYSFTVTEDASFVANFILDQGEVTQENTLAQGYNWWSTYIEQEGINGLEMLENSLGGNGVAIRSQASGYIDYYGEDYGWWGSLASINNESSYRVVTNAPCTIIMTGSAAAPLQHPITLNHGWTWMGYVPSTAMDVNTAMAGMEASDGDMLKSQQGYADYYPGYGWFGSLNTVEPGMGLMYYSSSGETVTFTYPDNTRSGELKQNLTAENNHWKPNTFAYPDNMTVMAVVELDDAELSSDNYELAAFANGECRGSVKLTYAEPLRRHVAFLTISGKDAAELSFRLYDTETGMEYYDAEESLDFVADAIVGDADDLYIIHFRGTTGMDELASKVQVYPNPVNVGERFSINVADDVKTPVRVEIVNALGVETLRATSVQTPAQLTAPATAGVYTLRITVEGKGTVVRKLVVK